MQRYRIVAQLSLIFSILNLVLAAPIMSPGKHEERADEVVAAEDVAAMPDERLKEFEAVASTSSPSKPDAMASSQYWSFLDGSTSSGHHPTSHLSSAPSVSSSGYLGDISPSASVRWEESPPPYAPSSDNLAEMSLPEPWQGLPLSPDPIFASTRVSIPSQMWRQDEPPPPLPHSELTELDSPPKTFTPSRHPSPSSPEEPVYASAADRSLSSHYFSGSDGLSPSHDSIPEGSLTSPPENAKFLNENMVKKLKIAGVIALISGVIATPIAGTQIKHRDHQDR